MMTIERSRCAVLPLVAKQENVLLLEGGAMRHAYLPPTKYWQKRLYNWDKRVSVSKAPVVEFRCGRGKNAKRMAFWCLGLSTASGMRSYAYKDGPAMKELPRIGEPNGPHFVIEFGGRIELTGGAA